MSRRWTRRCLWALPAVVGLMLVTGCRQGGAQRTAVIRCTPGERVDVSCGCLGLGSACDGDPGIRLCDATLANGACEPEHAITSAGDRALCDGGCPLASTFCPQSGMVAIRTFARPDYDGATAAYTCAWAVRRSAIQTSSTATFACIPGERVQASCGCEGLGRWCEGDPIMRACAPGAACTDSASSLDSNDDTCSRCPYVDAFCPAAGAIVIATAPLSSGGRYRCDFGVVGQDGRSLAPSGI